MASMKQYQMSLEFAQVEQATFYIKTSAPAALLMAAPDADIAKGPSSFKA
jgi:hypothetical protein